ncbi:hypothetical protein Tco_0374356, partial [Tanacetum coccineum]
MGDENPIRTLEDYSKPSHEGYRNTIKLLVGNNVVPLRFDTIQLVQNGCSFHGLQSEDPNQHLKDFLKLVDSLDLDGENRERTRMRLFQFSLRDQASNWLEHLPAGSITTWEGMSKRARNTRGQASSSREETMEEKVLLSHSSTLSTPIPSLDHNGLTFSKSTSPSSASLFANYLPCLSLMRLLVEGIRYGAILNGLRRAEMINSTHLTHLFWPSIGDDGFNEENTKAKSIRDPRIKLAHQCITMTIT